MSDQAVRRGSEAMMPSAGAKQLAASILRHPLFGVLAGLVALFIAFTAINGSTFASAENLRNIGIGVAITLVLATGLTFVIITAGFDLSIGSVLVFAAVAAVKAMTAVGGGGWGVALLGLAAALVAGAAWGALNGGIVAYAKLNPIIVTLGSLGAALGLAQVITGGIDLVEVPENMTTFGNGRVLGVPNLVVVAASVALVFGIVLARTVFGRHTYAVGSSKQAAIRAGIDVKKQLVLVYMLSGMTAGLAGWMSLALFSTTNISGHAFDNLNAVTAALLGGVSLFGGVGTIAGTVCGAFVPVMLANGLVISGVQSYWQQVVTGAVLVLAVYLDRERREHAE